jgi:hypothetical protein
MFLPISGNAIYGDFRATSGGSPADERDEVRAASFA